MRPALIVFLIFILISLPAAAQVPIQAGSKAAVTGSVLSEDVWTAQNNPAGLPAIKTFRAGIYVQRLFNIKSLNSGALALTVPIKKGQNGCIGLSSSAFNSGAAFHTQLYTLSYGLKLSADIQAGIGLHAINLRFSDIYGGAVIPAGSASITYNIRKKTSIALHGFNIAPAHVKGLYEKQLPFTIQAGIRQKLSEEITLYGQAEHELKQKTALLAAIEYKPAKYLSLEAGIKTNPMLFATGLGITLKAIRLDLSFVFGQVLGTTPHVSLEYIPEDEK